MNLIELATLTQTSMEEAHARLNELAAEHAAVIAAKDATLAEVQGALDALTAYQTAMVDQVTAVLQSGDPAQYEALAVDFLTPVQEKARQAKLAHIAALKAEAAALEAEIA